MTITLEIELVRQCAPTLAGLKAASLFRYKFAPLEDPSGLVAGIRRHLQPKGIHIEFLSYDLVRRSGLLYVFRPHQLARILKDKESSSFLKRQGYKGATGQEIFEEMSLRLARRDSFPHEIGILLDYPLEDVQAYMACPKDKGVCSGCWKAYGHKEEAACYFAKCKKCTKVYWRCHCEGTPLSKLAVAQAA